MLYEVFSSLNRTAYIEIAIGGVLLAILFELLTIWCRFGRGLIATQHTAVVGRFTRGVRIHHGYLGVFSGIGGVGTLPAFEFAACLLFVLAIGLVLSDLVHHFLVLWPITGSHQFDLVYPRPQPAEVVVERSPR